ncbi:MAG TPA: hypothetical protein ACFYD3_06030 [Candidatus Hypogeohydataceae bacterium YC41]
MDPETLRVLITSGGPLGILVFLVIAFLWFFRERDAKQETISQGYHKRINELTAGIIKLEKVIEELSKKVK